MHLQSTTPDICADDTLLYLSFKPDNIDATVKITNVKEYPHYIGVKINDKNQPVSESQLMYRRSL